MGSDQNKGKMPQVKQYTISEVKTYIMIIQNRLSLYRNKKVDSIRKKKKEVEKSLRENNLDVAKAKMDSIIREEDMMTVYDILYPLCEILKERVTYIMSSAECPADLRAQLDSIIYASTRVEIQELYVLRDFILTKYGSNYLQKADTNADKLVNVNLVEKLKVKPASDAFLTIRLKQLCKEKKINFEFPEMFDGPNFDNGGGNPYSPSNPFDSQNNNYNPYASNIGPGNNNNYGNNNYGQQWNNGPGPYGPPSNNNNNDFNPYASVQKNNFNNNSNYNPYGPQSNQSQFGQQPPQNNFNNYQPPGKSQFGQQPPQNSYNNNNDNPYGPPPNQSQFGQQPPNPYGPPPNQSQFSQQPPNNSKFGQNNSQFGQQPPNNSQFGQQPPSNSQFGQQPPNNSQFNPNFSTQKSQFSQKPPQNNSQINPNFSNMNNNNNNNNNDQFPQQPPNNSQFGKASMNNNNNNNDINPYGSIQNNNSAMGKSNMNPNNDNPYGNNNNINKIEESQFNLLNNSTTNKDNNPNLNRQGSNLPPVRSNYSKDNININQNNPNPFENQPSQNNIIIPKPSVEEDPNANPFLKESNVKDSQSNLFYEQTVNQNNENPYGNDNMEMNNPFGEGFNKSIANSVSNPYTDNVSNNNVSNNNMSVNDMSVQKSQNNVQNSMQGSIVDDVKFKESILKFNNNNNDDATNDFPKSE